MIFQLTRAAVPRIKADQTRRIMSRPHLHPLRERIKQDLAHFTKAGEVLGQSARVYTLARGNSSLFVRFDRANMALEAASASARFEEQECAFTDEWSSSLIARTITSKRISVHVPNIQEAQVEFVNDREIDQRSVDPHDVTLVTLPHLRGSRGALLLTPLGVENSDTLGYGFIYEHRVSTPFSPEAIQDARALSAVFVLEIAKRIALEHPEVG